jgi:hypothetical protein
MERTIYSKDVSIVRQSSIKIALKFCQTHGIAPSFKQLRRLTDLFCEEALMAPDEEFNENVSKVDLWILEQKAKLGK